MSTVLWANLLENGEVRSEHEDRHALYKHARKLDRLGKMLGLRSFLALLDTTDQRHNLAGTELPDGMESTDEVMAMTGEWVDCAEGAAFLQALLDHVRSDEVRFGLVRNEHEEVVSELQAVIAFARSATSPGAKFNFSVVM